jgi:predicted nucleotidyltransferase
MMSTITLSDALFSRTRKGIFRELFRNQEGFHLRELERRIGVNGRHLLRELHTLRDAGILIPKRVGNAVIYRFNPDCPIYEDIQSIIRKTVGIADILKEMLEPFIEQIEFAYVFGSHARGEQRTDSDIDLMIVGSATRRQFSSAIRQTETVLQREINAVFYTSDEYGEALEDSNSFISKVHNGPRINLSVNSEYGPTRHGTERTRIA